jgi:hypothetical protein
MLEECQAKSDRSTSRAVGGFQMSPNLKHTDRAADDALPCEFARKLELGKKLKHEKLEETKHGLFRDCFLGAPE